MREWAECYGAAHTGTRHPGGIELRVIWMLIGLLAAGATTADVTIQSASRSISGSGTVDIEGVPRLIDADQQNGPDSGLWDTGVGAIKIVLDGGIGFARTESDQVSEIVQTSADSIRLFGYCEPRSGADIQDPGFASFARSASTSRLRTVFVVSEPTNTLLDIFIGSRRDQFEIFSGSATQTTTASYSLVGSLSGTVASNAVTDTIANGIENPVTATEMIPLVLQPDTYTFTLEAAADAFASGDAIVNGLASFDALLEVPEPEFAALEIVALTTLRLLRSRWPRARRIGRSGTSPRETNDARSIRGGSTSSPVTRSGMGRRIPRVFEGRDRAGVVLQTRLKWEE